MNIDNISNEDPYKILKYFYLKAIEKDQSSIEAFLIASYSMNFGVNCRYVNLKFIKENEFIFFSNYESNKAKQFLENDRISTLIYWNKVHVQIRMTGTVSKKSADFNNIYFRSRSKEKNALSISSSQSKRVNSYEDVIKSYDTVFRSNDLYKCPDYWGGYSFIPDFFEFWEGDINRINKRTCYERQEDGWIKYYLEP
jgi:pyridoxamine 5'-phosphate oxidase